MSFVGVAVGVGGLATLGSAAIGSSAAGNAADKQAAASQYATDIQHQEFNQEMQAQAPWRAAGQSALYGPGGLMTPLSGIGGSPGGGGTSGPTDPAQLAQQAYINQRLSQLQQQQGTAQFNYSGPGGLKGLSDDQLKAMATADWGSTGSKLPQYQTSNFTNQAVNQTAANYQVDPNLTRSFTADDFQKDPGYDFRMQQGQQALERSAAARGGLQSGGTLKALTQYGQDYASNEYQNAYNRFTNDQSNRFNRLSAIAGVGQTANNAMASAGQNFANQAGQNAIGAANAQGAAGIAGANAWGGALSSIGSMPKTWMDYTMMNKYLNKGS